MELYIELDDSGNPLNHPMLGDNVREARGVDTENLPSNYAVFERIPCPTFLPEDFKTLVSLEPTYQWVDGIVKDVWEVRDLTEEERSEVIGIHRKKVQKALSFIIEEAEGFINDTESGYSEEYKQSWRDYLSVINAISLPDDPFDVTWLKQVPRRPQITEL